MTAVPSEHPTIVLPAISKHSATFIFVHGLGDNGYGLKPIADKYREDPDFAHIKWILPHSPSRRVTANMGTMMPSWIDIYSFGFNTTEDEQGMHESAAIINKFIVDEIGSGTDPSRIILGGFSQGGTMSLLTGLTGSNKLAGIATLSGWLPLRSKFKELASQYVSSIPIFWGYGDRDPLVTAEIMEHSTQILADLGMQRAKSADDVNGLLFNVYKGVGHTTCEEELKDLKEWIKKILPGEQSSA